MDTATAYLTHLENLLRRLRVESLPSLAQAARLVADCFDRGRFLFLFGTGHSHMLAEELFYRAGGPARAYAILEPTLMLHESASASTEIERCPSYAARILNNTPLGPDDVLLIASNSGRNGVAIDMALLARERGAKTIALTSVAHSLSQPSRHASGLRLMDVCHVVLDNLGCPGDAAIPLPQISRNVAPTSTVTGAALLHAMMCAAYDRMARPPEVYASSNVDGGEAINDTLIDKYKGFIKPL